MADYTESEGDLLALQPHTYSVTDTWVIGTEVATDGWIEATIYVYHANTETTANATGVKYIIEGRPVGAGAGDNALWAPIQVFQTGTTAAVRAQIIAAGEAAAQTQLEVKADPTTDFTSGEVIYLDNHSVQGNCDWGVVDYSATGGNHYVYVRDGIPHALAEDDELWTQAEVFPPLPIRLGGIAYIRGLVNHAAATGSNIDFRMTYRAVTAIA